MTYPVSTLAEAAELVAWKPTWLRGDHKDQTRVTLVTANSQVRRFYRAPRMLGAI